MSSLTLERLLFDASNPTDGPLIGSYLLGSGGSVISETGTALDVNISGATGLAIFAEDAAASSGDDGQSILLVREDSLAVSTSADGDYGHFKSTNKGELYVKATDSDALLTTIDADTGAIATDIAAIEVLLTSIDSDTSTIAGDTTSIDSTLTALSKAEDAAHSSGDQGIMGLAVRNDTESSLVSADGDYAPLQVDSVGRLRVIGDLDVVGNVDDDDVDSGNPLKVGSRSHFASAALTALSATGDRADLLSDAYRRVYINDAPNIGIASVAVAVGTSAVALPTTALAGRTRVMIQNNGTQNLFVGPAGVTTASGIEVSKGGTLTLEAGQAIGLYGISTLAGQDIRVLELA